MDEATWLSLMVLGYIIGVVILYYIIKTAVKSAIRESGLARVEATVRAQATAQPVATPAQPVATARTWSAGWYVYPGTDGSEQRYYDGSKWTEQCRPRQ
ncbi:DUF2510 domain-containing protein [Phytoactinopolyspora sp. XMNu-373]|uniref:DUF2510 domain-containing protein n=2 Tax=Phytoactinopolyspora mesophila TaxID=2650750 RepID=A0A7K3M141_9ACTN|nr:DUF2510 domain-containing protein [Phytoactinopolyspora mesophila]